MAFVSASASAFHGRRTLTVSGNIVTARPAAAAAPRASPTMRNDFGLDKMLSKYAEMSSTGPAAPSPPYRSAVFEAFRGASSERTMVRMLAKYEAMTQEPPSDAIPSPPAVSDFWQRVASDRVNLTGAYSEYMAKLRAETGLSGVPGGADPVSSAADQYMADIVSRIYKTVACAGGVYSVRCTEGTVRGQAELSRTAALAYDFRRGQRSTLQKYADLFETRKGAVGQAHQCGYEEKLNGTYGAMAASLVRGANEAKATCIRYSSGGNKAEKYMISCVDKQNKFRAVPYGVYDVMCSDGTIDGMAENKRIVAMSARFRFGQVSKIMREQQKFDASKYARDNFAHMCSYEEKLFNKYAGVSGAMRAPSVRYSS